MAQKTPGVYIKEISLFPPSVAEVATAIPAFIGYTERAERKGASLLNVPTKVASLLEYRELFGGEPAIDSVDVVVDRANNFAVDSLTFDKRFYMYEALRLFFDNGGGQCYIVSVGSYAASVANGDENDPDASPGLRVGLKALEKYDEPTIICFPDAPLVAAEADLYTLQQRALAQCARLQDRVSVFDLKEGGRALQISVDNFRNSVGINNLKYGAAYTPWLYSSYPKSVDFALFRDSVTDSDGAAVDLATLTSDDKVNALVSAAATSIDDRATLDAALDGLLGGKPTLKDRYADLRNQLAAGTDGNAAARLTNILTMMRQVAVAIPPLKTSLEGQSLTRDLDALAPDKLKSGVAALVALEKNADVLTLLGVPEASATYNPYNATGWLASLDTDKDGQAIDDIAASGTDYDAGAPGNKHVALAIAQDLDAIFELLDGFIVDVLEASAIHRDMAQTTLYNGHSIISNIVEHIKLELARVPPSGAIAGLYAFVDDARGVWKAPANVSVSSVLGPAEQIDFFDQEDLNVDVVGGKSINAIRTFSGRGTLVWGARTLAGNDNEWRYVPVRRFFNMVEESIKKATAFAVFEPNSATLWVKLKGMIENYLIQKWREGALAGATPEQAFFVKIGLGETMTAQDILEGSLIVEIGMAVVRPAEFIILKFSHKLQEA
jgi:phage tail sheath protein FI